MNSLEELVTFAEQLIIARTENSLSPIQKIVLRESICETKKNYTQIANENNYSETYIKHLVAPKLWKLLSQALGKKVNRNNCRIKLESQLETSTYQTDSGLLHISQITMESPEGQVPLASPFYIERSSLEPTCYQEILTPGAFLRIKAPRKMGKTSLLARIIAYGTTKNYHTLRLSLDQVESKLLTSTERFLRWLCANVTQQLELPSELDNYWDEDVGSLVNCTHYFQEYLLRNISSPLILALDEINQLFAYPSLTRDFLSLLRHWYEKTKDIALWQQLRLIVAHSTDVYIPLKTNQSPLNVGLAVELPPFTKQEVEKLAQLHKLQLTASELEQLMELTRGFPYLVRLALYQSVRRNLPLEQLLPDAATNTGILSQHLHQQLWYLQKNSDLAEAFQQLIKSNSSLQLEQEIAFKLKSLGLVDLENNQVRVSCRLYRDYFSTYFLNSKE
ncbi:MAG: serine/threonine protein kinase [Symploca sp. SIO2G7]|nr:serine/threonine protein kinase [Symploca sp. SIO2G7]